MALRHVALGLLASAQGTMGSCPACVTSPVASSVALTGSGTLAHRPTTVARIHARDAEGMDVGAGGDEFAAWLCAGATCTTGPEGGPDLRDAELIPLRVHDLCNGTYAVYLPPTAALPPGEYLLVAALGHALHRSSVSPSLWFCPKLVEDPYLSWAKKVASFTAWDSLNASTLHTKLWACAAAWLKDRHVVVVGREDAAADKLQALLAPVALPVFAAFPRPAELHDKVAATADAMSYSEKGFHHGAMLPKGDRGDFAHVPYMVRPPSCFGNKTITFVGDSVTAAIFSSTAAMWRASAAVGTNPCHPRSISDTLRFMVPSTDTTNATVTLHRLLLYHPLRIGIPIMLDKGRLIAHMLSRSDVLVVEAGRHDIGFYPCMDKTLAAGRGLEECSDKHAVFGEYRANVDKLAKFLSNAVKDLPRRPAVLLRTAFSVPFVVGVSCGFAANNQQETALTNAIAAEAFIRHGFEVMDMEPWVSAGHLEWWQRGKGGAFHDMHVGLNMRNKAMAQCNLQGTGFSRALAQLTISSVCATLSCGSPGHGFGLRRPVSSGSHMDP